MSGNLGDIGSLPEVVANEMIDEIIKSKDYTLDATLEDCISLIRKVDESGPLASNDLSDGEIEGLANLLFERINGR
jgi:hypothetical protein